MIKFPKLYERVKFGFSFFNDVSINNSDLVLLFGSPGSGKSLVMSFIAEKMRSRGCSIFVNDEFSSYVNKTAVITNDVLSRYKLPPGSGVFIDEASLFGFDNRDHASNFRSKGLLDFFKKHRHYENFVVMSNQGWEECDKKIRDYLATKLYLCENHFLFVTATLIHKETVFSSIDGKPIDRYYTNGLIYSFLHPGERLFVSKRKYGRLYSTINPSVRPLFKNSN